MRLMRKKIHRIPSRKAEALKVLTVLGVLIVFNLFVSLVNVLPSQARKDMEKNYGMTDTRTIWSQWEWGMSMDQKKSYVSVNDKMLCFSNVGLQGWFADFKGGGWDYGQPLVLKQQTDHPAQCGIYELRDSNTYIVYLVGRVADYRIEKLVFEIRWGFDVETIELTENDFIRNEDGVFFVYRMNASDRMDDSIASYLIDVHMMALDGENNPLSWTDEKGYVTERYYVEDRVLADPSYYWYE